MKIGIFSPYNIFKSGGVQEHVNSQAEVLRKRGHDVTIITPRPMGKDKNKKAPKGIMYFGASRRIRSISATSADVSMNIDAESIDMVLAEQFDVIHVHEPIVPIAARQLLSKIPPSTIRVGTFHAALPGNVLGKSVVATFKAYARNVVPHVDVITAVSPAAINYIENYTDLPINFVPNGIDFKTYKNTKSKRSSNTILFIGRLEKRKGARYLLKAFEQIKLVRPDMKLLIAGKGPLERSLKTYVSENNIQDVEFLGFIEDDEKVRLLQTCSVYTSPALYGESFGIVLTEAMACGIPTVAHNNDGYSSVLKETGRLSLVDCKDIQAYAERLLTMIEEEPVRKLWQDWAEVYVKQFDYEKIVDSYEKLYKEHIRK